MNPANAIHRKRIAPVALAAAFSLASPFLSNSAALAVSPRTWNFLTTGNGHGFQVYDTNQKKILTFLEHPYRYLRPRADPKSDGVGRRNLVYDFYFGLRGPGGAGWLNQAPLASDPEYVDQSNIVHAALTLGGVTADAYYFAPFGYEGNAMVGLLHAPGASHGFALFNFHMGGGSPDTPDSNGESVSYLTDQKAFVEVGPGGGAMVYVAIGGVDQADCNPNLYTAVQGGSDLGAMTTCASNNVVPAMEKTLGADGWMAVAMQYVEDPADAPAAAKALNAWAAMRAPSKILDDAKAEFEAWRKPPAGSVKLSADELKVWRQGETTLRMGQVREPNRSGRVNHGMMLASLPPGEWHTGWVRDGQYAIVALARMGHWEEARMALDFHLNATPVGKYKQFVNNQDYRISVCRYFGTGEEEADYSGQTTPNVETDGWGLFLWSARNYVDSSGDAAWLGSTTTLGSNVYDAINNGVAGPLQANMDPTGLINADSSIWEVHDASKRQFAYTSLAAARGFCDMAAMSQRAGKSTDIDKYKSLAAKVTDGLMARMLFNNAIGGSIEGITACANSSPPIGCTDAAAVEAINWEVLSDPMGKNANATLDLLGGLRVSSGGFKRLDYGNGSYDNNEWILIDLRMSDAMRRAGRVAAADSIIATVVDKAAANFYLLPELYNAVPADGDIGKYTGSIPMVGYGGGAWILTMLHRAGIYEPGDCGTSVLVDGGVVMADGGGNGTGGTGGTGGGVHPVGPPYVPACLCAIVSHTATAKSTFALLLAPWLVIALRLVSRRRAAKPTRGQ